MELSYPSTTVCGEVGSNFYSQMQKQGLREVEEELVPCHMAGDPGLKHRSILVFSTRLCWDFGLLGATLSSFPLNYFQPSGCGKMERA